MQKFIVLKPDQGMNVINERMKIKQGDAIPLPAGMEVDPRAFDIFEDRDEARKVANQNARKWDTVRKHGITTRKTLAAQMAKDAKEPTQEDREEALKNAKILDKEGNLYDPAELEQLKAQKAELEAKNAELEKKLGSKDIDVESLLDQNGETTIKRIKAAELTPNMAKEVFTAEKAGKKRGAILGLLGKIIKALPKPDTDPGAELNKPVPANKPKE